MKRARISLLSAFVLFGAVLWPVRVLAQATPGPSPSPLGPPFGANDPCTTLAAIVTRPTVTNSVCPVHRGHLLVETGYSNTSAEANGNTVAVPQALLRIGLPLSRLELDLVPPSMLRTSSLAPVFTGTSDVGIGLKYLTWYRGKWSTGAQASITFPTGSSPLSPGVPTANYALNASYAMTKTLSLATSLSVQPSGPWGARYTSIVPSLVAMLNVGANGGLFAEVATFSQTLGAGTGTRTQLLAGIYRDLGSRF
jgi:hypothetical protein